MLRRYLAAAILLLVPVIAGCDDNSIQYNESTARIAVGAILHFQLEAYRRNNVDAYYSTYSKQAQSRCSLEQFKPVFAQKQSGTGGVRLGITDLNIVFKGEEFNGADVRYKITRPDDSVLREVSSTLVRQDDFWFQDDSPC